MMRTLILGLALAVIPTSVLADQAFSIPFNQNFLSPIYLQSVPPGQCLTTTTFSKVVGTGSACGSGGGGGGVTSVTAGSSGNMSFSPTTGAVIGDITENPIFTGQINSTLGNAGAALQTSGNYPIAWKTSFGDSVNQNSSNAFSIANIRNDTWGIYDLTSSSLLIAMDSTGALGVNNLNDANLTPGNCVQAAANGRLTTTGSACGGGGGGAVTSVTAGSSGNLTVSPTTGAVVADVVAAPTFTGSVTSTSLFNPAFIATNTQFAQWLGSTGDTSKLTADGTLLVGGVVTNSAFGIKDVTNSNQLIAVDTGGELGVRQGVFAQSLNASNLSPGMCLKAVGSGPQYSVASTNEHCGGQHGNVTITASAGSCVAGSPITFTTAAPGTPDIVMSTSPVVGDTAAPTSISPTGFTPELCSTTSNAAATVYWIATSGSNF